MTKKIENFQLMSKPSGSICNLDCTYCFYLEKEKLYPERKNHWKMDEVTLENYVRKNIAGQKSDIVDFIWQGGEPTLLGLDFFKKAVELQEQYCGGKRINNFFQTNGTKLNDAWCSFLKKHNFLVGISIDGDRISNDSYRLSRVGNSTFDDTMKGLRALQRHKVAFNTLTVVNAENVKRPMDVYNFLKRIGSRYMQFIPLVERKSGQPDKHGLTLINPDFSGQCSVTEWSVPSTSYGEFLNTIFDHWAVNDLGSVFVMNFEQTMARAMGQPGSCSASVTCGGNIIVEANGDIYSCDHYVYPEYKLGNINIDNPESLVNSERNIYFGNQKLVNISSNCQGCLVRPVCNGGCPKQRFNISNDGKLNKNYLCEGFAVHFHHALPIMNHIMKLINNSKTPGHVRKIIKNHYYRNAQ